MSVRLSDPNRALTGVIGPPFLISGGGFGFLLGMKDLTEVLSCGIIYLWEGMSLPDPPLVKAQ